MGVSSFFQASSSMQAVAGADMGEFPILLLKP
jgi:hypothetical protein